MCVCLCVWLCMKAVSVLEVVVYRLLFSEGGFCGRV